MAEIQQNDDKGGKKKGKQKKVTIRVDFTPMVDMNMLLITFFMLCTSLIKPQTMELAVPSKDKVSEEEQTKAADSRSITLLLGGDNKVYYYLGMPNYEDYNSLKETSYNADGIRALLLERNKNVVAKVNELKKQKKETNMSDEEYNEKLKEIKKDPDKTSPIVMIKATDDATYKNMVDALDEMQICSVGTYALVDITEGDEWLIENLKTAGGLGEQSETK